jgi:hypothetical protein
MELLVARDAGILLLLVSLLTLTMLVMRATRR